MTLPDFLMAYSPSVPSHTFGPHLRLGEFSGWATLILSVIGGIRALGHVIANITPDAVNPWLILIASSITGLVAVGTLAYSRIIRVKLDGETLEEIYKANNEAIRAGHTIPFPNFLPKGAITVTTKTTIDVQAKPPEPPAS